MSLFELRFHASAGSDKANGYWHDFTQGPDSAEHARVDRSRLVSVVGDRVEVDLDLSFESGGVKGNVIAVLCR